PPAGLVGRTPTLRAQPGDGGAPTRGGIAAARRRGAPPRSRASVVGGPPDHHAPLTASDHSLLERKLDWVERAGNRMAHPAVLFLALCGVVIVLSQVMYWFDVKATYEVVPTPPVAAEQIYYGGSTQPANVGPTTPVPAKDYDKVVTETTKVQGLLTGLGV